MSNHQIPIGVTGDVISAIAVAGSLMGYLPDLAAAAAFIWYVIQVYDWWQARRRMNGPR